MNDSPIVTLRGQRNDDWDALYALLNRESVVPFTDELPYIADDVFRERYTNTEPGIYRLVGEISLPSGRNRFVGMAQFQVRKRRTRHAAALRFAIAPDYHGADVEAAFLARIVAFAEDWLAMRRIQTVAYEDDEHTLALLEGHGFTREATLRRYAFRRGVYADACLMARLKDAEAGAQPEAESAPEEHLPSPVGERQKSAKKAKSAGVLVRGIEASDWEDCADIVRGEQVYANTLQLPYLSRDVTRDRLENPPDDMHMLAAVVDDRVVGMLGLHLGVDRRAHAASLGMMVHQDYQGRGVGSALMQAAVELAENWLNISRISLEVFIDNAAAIALYRNFGFAIEGTLRMYGYRAGRYVDAYVMARVRDDNTA